MKITGERFNDNEVNNEIYLSHIYNNKKQNEVLNDLTKRLEKEQKMVEDTRKNIELETLKIQLKDAYGKEFNENLWNTILLDQTTPNINEKIKQMITDKNHQKGEDEKNLTNLLTECFSDAFSDYASGYTKFTPNAIESIMIANPECNTISKLVIYLNQHRKNFKWTGTIFKKWNKYQIWEEVADSRKFSEVGGKFDQLWILTESYADILKLFNYSVATLEQLKHHQRREEKVREYVESWETIKRQKNQTSSFMSEIEKYSQGKTKEEREDFEMEIIGHCESKEEISSYMKARGSYIALGKNMDNYADRLKFEDYYRNFSKEPDMVLKIESMVGNVPIENVPQITALEGQLMNTYPKKFSHKVFNSTKESWFKNNGKAYLLYLQYEQKYQEYLRFFQKRQNYDTFLDFAIHNGGDFTTLGTYITKEVNELTDAEKRIQTSISVLNKINELNELLPKENQYSVQTVAVAYRNETIPEIDSKLQNLINEQESYRNTNENLDEAIIRWRALFPEDLKSSTDWRTEFGSNGAAINAINKLSHIYEFWYRTHPYEGVNLWKYIHENAQDSINTAQEKLQKYYDENKYKYNTWDGNNLLKKYVQQYYQGFGRSIAEAAGFLFGKFDGNLEDCLKFFEGYEKNLKINQSFQRKEIKNSMTSDISSMNI